MFNLHFFLQHFYSVRYLVILAVSAKRSQRRVVMGCSCRRRRSGLQEEALDDGIMIRQIAIISAVVINGPVDDPFAFHAPPRPRFAAL